MDDKTSSGKPLDIYARVSELKRQQKKEPSTEGQVAVCRDRLGDLDLKEGKVLVDLDRSAWNPAVKRPAWDELMDRLEGGISGGAIVFDLERLTRIPKDGERMIDLADRGILILDSESEYDLTTPNGKKSFRDAINAAAYYSDRLSTRVRRGMRRRAMSGQPLGDSNRFGFEADRVTVREDEAEILRELTRRLLAGETMRALVAELDERGIRSRRGQPIKITSLQALVTRPVNCGRITHTDKKTGARTVMGHLPGKPIVSEEDFDRLCAMFASRRRGRPNNPIYLCSGYSVCGRPECDEHPLHVRPRYDMKPYEDGEVIRSYICNPGVGGCGKVEVDQRTMDAAVSALVIEILSDPRNTTAIESAARQIASETARLDLAIAEAEDVAEALADRLGRGEITLTRYDVAVKPLDARIAKLRAERDALPDPGSADPMTQQPLEATREQWKQRWDAADHKERRDLLKMALRGKHIVVAPERGRGRNDEAGILRRISIE
jgi:DNA invertase Pin-like site-specific DNA recombinase